MKNSGTLQTLLSSLSLACTLIILGVCPLYAKKPESVLNKQTIAPAPEKQTWITVYVHGIMSIQRHINLGNFYRFLHDEVENTLYSKTVELMRLDNFFYQNQAMQGFGLEKIEPDVVKKGNSSGAMAYLFNEIEKFAGLHNDNHYYTFGWSGLLSAKRRYKDARELFDALDKLTNEFKAKGINPKIRLIGYSHGGNVVLNVGAVSQKERQKSTLSVDEAILLGMPVQEETDYLVNAPIFKHVYHFYSNKDRVQKLDFFSPSRVSYRRFKPRRGLTLPSKLTQIKIKIIRPRNSIRKNHKKFRQSFNLNNRPIVTGKSNLLRNASPGHVELWFFGWTPVHYRQNYPLQPLPTATFIPLILHNIKGFADSVPPSSSVTADIRPTHEVMLVKKRHPRKEHKIIPLISRKQFNELTDAVLKYAPDIYNGTLYKEHIKIAFKKATDYYDQKKKEASCKKRSRRARRRCRRRRHK